MSQENTQFCFCTLALGRKYRQLANLLAEDIAKYSPSTRFVILTDQPEEFSHFPQVLAVKHKMQGVKCYHDKRFAIAKSLSLFDACIFLDSDMRILAKVPEELPWLLEPGIKARACMTMPEKFAKMGVGKHVTKELNLVKQAAAKLNLLEDWENIMFVHEYLISVTKDMNKEVEFLETWEKLAHFFEINGLYYGEGNAIALAAHKVGMKIAWSEFPGVSFFNKHIELVRIKNGQSTMEEMQIYFTQHDQIIYPKQNVIKKVFDKLDIQIRLMFRQIRLKFISMGLKKL